MNLPLSLFTSTIPLPDSLTLSLHLRFEHVQVPLAEEILKFDNCLWPVEKQMQVARLHLEIVDAALQIHGGKKPDRNIEFLQHWQSTILLIREASTMP